MSEQATQQQEALRQDVIESAVRFLTDPKVATSTLAKKISFLETKGLTSAEIEDALARLVRLRTAAFAAAGRHRRPQLDWKDYFIAAVVAGGLGYGLYVLAQRYVAPLLQARDDKERLEAEKKLLVEQNEQTQRQLTALNETTTKVLEALATQSAKTNEAIEGMTALLDKMTIEDVQREVAGVAKKERDSGSIADVHAPAGSPTASSAVSPDMKATLTPPPAVTVEDVPEAATGLGVSDGAAVD
ncbi:hypothetical protein DL89DRAFT_319807 [Linderina pennispora]|uniref:Peroxisomal membrane protein PEX14 n=1 Tax=Linderina pennispora TaxID=61395 RepID=A0A1Y1WL54_9FUNG|nr:uncharacterized protein DL89DRAFT_319807 [Linderina pennispora]ORX74213.1 hypothetical protein DL89DRAFT_319807 [Linderina pennispora]